ncbi:hypothetical protein AADR41_41155 [Streptomyces sp. CLV115]|uniref:hypothetical protein n=1 Tax=Streptomyces sp. CLV115 TaxID=3138502 RepID=UPI00313F1045
MCLPLIRQAAIPSILDGTERIITKASLDQARLDHLAETHRRPVPKGFRSLRR